jgi:hypothetical protein
MATAKKAVQKAKSSVPAIATKKDQKSPALDPQSLIEMAIKQGASLETVNSLLLVRQQLRDEQAAIAFREALSRFQGSCPIIPKKKIVKDKYGKDRYKYAPLDDIVKTVQPHLAENNLSYDIETVTTKDPAGIQVNVKVFHTFGHSKESSFYVPVDPESYMTDQQRWASAQTYAKRYAFCNALGILTGDDDTDAADTGKKAEVVQPQIDTETSSKIEKLSDYIKDGFRSLGYTRKAVVLFCEKFGWDQARIKREIDAIASAKEVSADA